MGSLYYIGLNAYQQCPQEKKTTLPKILRNWQKYSLQNSCEVSCTFMKVVLKTNDSFIVYDDFVVISRENKLWKSNYEDSWSQIIYSSSKENDDPLWNEKLISKLDFVHGNQTIIILLNDGSVMELDRNNKLSTIYNPTLDRAIDISCGFEHVLILTESGCVMSFGNGSHGQLGHGDLLPSLESLQVLGLAGLKVIKIAAGGWHSCAVTDSGDLYTWGWNNFGQLTEIKDDSYLEDGYGVAALPMVTNIDELGEKIVVDVACGTRHTVVITDEHEMYSTGWNEYGQLGLNDLSITKVNKFTKTNLQLGKGKKVLRCGPWSTVVYEDEIKSGS